MLDLVYENQTGDSLITEEFFRKILKQASTHLGFSDKKVEVGLHLVTPERIQKLNNQYRQKDTPTDVLSFPLDDPVRSLARAEGASPKDLGEATSYGMEDFYGILPVGDIFICLDVAEKQAKKLEIPLRRFQSESRPSASALNQELTRLAVHGFLHLFGHDHERSPEDADTMFNIEEKILEEIQNTKHQIPNKF